MSICCKWDKLQRLKVMGKLCINPILNTALETVYLQNSVYLEDRDSFAFKCALTLYGCYATSLSVDIFMQYIMIGVITYKNTSLMSCH